MKPYYVSLYTYQPDQCRDHGFKDLQKAKEFFDEMVKTMNPHGTDTVILSKGRIGFGYEVIEKATLK